MWPISFSWQNVRVHFSSLDYLFECLDPGLFTSQLLWVPVDEHPNQSVMHLYRAGEVAVVTGEGHPESGCLTPVIIQGCPNMLSSGVLTSLVYSF